MTRKTDRLFVDTSYVIARFNRRDQHHEISRQLSSDVTSCRQLWITEAVLFELGAAFSHPPHRRLFIGLWDQFHNGDERYQVAETTESRREAAVQIFCAHTDKSWSLADCLSFVVMREEEFTEALTSDQHFVQAGFRALILETWPRYE